MEEFKIGLGVEIEQSELDNINNLIKNAKIEPIKLQLDKKQVQSQIDSIKTQIEKLSNIKITLTDASVGDSTGIQRTVGEVTQAYNDLMNLQRRINSIRLQIGGLDSTKNSSQITELSVQLNRLMADYNNLYQMFNRSFSTNQLDNLNRAFEITNGKISALNAKMSDTSTVQQQSVAYRELYNVSKQIGSLELKIGKLNSKTNANEIKILQTQLENLRQTYQQLQSSLQGNLSSTQLSNLGAMVYDTKDKLSQLDAKVIDTKTKLANGIVVDFNNGTFSNDMSKIDVDLSKIKIKSGEVERAVQELRTAFTNLQTANNQGDTDSLISAYERYQIALKNVKNQIDINKRAERQNLDAQKLVNARQALSSKMDVWLKNNSAAVKEFSHKIDHLKAKLIDCNEVELTGINSEFQDLIRQAQLAGKATMSFGDRLKFQLSKLGTYFTANNMISKALEGLRKMYDNVADVDTAMTGLYRVTNLTAEQYETLYKKMIISAKNYGSVLSDVINSTADWARLGFDPSTSAKLSEITAMYQHVTDIDNKTATENLVTAYKGFQEQLLKLYNGNEAQAIEYIADIFDKLGNEFAVSAEQVGAALTKCSSTLQQAGNTIQEASAMATGITEVTQDPEKSGSALKILSLRLRGMKGQLQELGEEVDENVESISKMQTQVLNFTKGKVNIFNDDKSFKSTYEIMDGIAEIYNELSDTDRANLLETIAGKNRANDVAALLSNWKQVESAMNAAVNAEGTAAEENERYMNSIKGKTATLTSAWQSLSNTFLDSETLKFGVDFLTKVLETLEKIFAFLDKGEPIFGGMAGIITPLVGGVAAYSSIKDNAGELINQFQFLIMLRIEYARKPFTNGNMNETMRKLVA